MSNVSLKCHAEYRWICITPLKVNDSSYSWDQVLNHIVEIWNSSDTSIDLTKLHKEIQDIGQSHLDFSTAQSANDFFLLAFQILSLTIICCRLSWELWHLFLYL